MPEMPQQQQASGQAVPPMAKEITQMFNTMMVQMMLQMLQSLSSMFGGKQAPIPLPMPMPLPAPQSQSSQVVVE
jgi:hypothetical protein